MSVAQIKTTLRSLADPSVAQHSQRFFKTGPGEYAEGDKFLGIRVPILRKQVVKNSGISIADAQKLITSKFHEERLFALLLLVYQYSKGSEPEKAEIYNFYLRNTAYINNWDLVDSSAYQIVGSYLQQRDKEILFTLSKSISMWERRISIISTYQFIKNNKYDTSFEISKILINDSEDLIHKAVGWMLREVGNRNPISERTFLNKHYKSMPRTMLRYAIEKFPEQERQKYLKGAI